ncbi:predicted protein [Scheffersomyces stipitis CBS 6054]|uniref:Uncharacterized protein n=1 Tax=Scheffersomyces stipitis (strain ATCC 58785 / CBS 6054 / NBRC 10063 / NRRL Y-11545) TaxID=322104 RepID=A3LQM1_PICST|nr:predicted protein [Scheffersomyces stipitis CBS 6054]ABN65226.2 predicted protein [Scheffersomyces stipitis CBS 6054]
MADLETVLITVAAALAINYLYNQYIHATKDVNELYLNEQSTVDSTRLANESAIYKSNKIAYANGLRIGLDIRYDHYKLRHGNLCDVWEIITKYASKSRGSGITIDNEFQPIIQLNYKISQFSRYLTSNKVKVVRINLNRFIDNFDILIAVISAMVNQITIELYDDHANLQDTDEGLFIRPPEVHSTLNEFVNEYTYEKDKGIALKITRKLNSSVLSTVEFTQLNIISSLASTIKHLPLSKEINHDDKIVVVQSSKRSNDAITNQLNKILLSFITTAQLVVLTENSSLSWNNILSHEPTILALNEKELQDLSLEKLKSGLNLNWYKKFVANQTLVYVNNGITNPRIFSPAQLNEFRCYLSSRLVMEFGYYNIIGPIILTDFYDYRYFSIASVKSWGCISQSLELKLTEVSDKSEGKLSVRGYSIGKSTNKVVNRSDQIEQNKNIMKANDGFMPLINVRGRWGNDGCLYIV